MLGEASVREGADGGCDGLPVTEAAGAPVAPAPGALGGAASTDSMPADAPARADAGCLELPDGDGGLAGAPAPAGCGAATGGLGGPGTSGDLDGGDVPGFGGDDLRANGDG